MLNGHMDPGVEMSGWTVDPYGKKFEDGWIWGMGAHDDKGGVVAAICGVEAIVRAGVRLRGDVLVCPVVAHKLGGAGTRALLKHGVRADMAINMEHSALTIATVCVGIVMARIRTRSPELFFRCSPEARAAYMNPIEQQCRIIEHIGPSFDPLPPGGWLTFTPHPDLPGFPTHTFDTIHKEHYYQPNYTGMSSRESELIFQLRTVPGQTVDGLLATLTEKQIRRLEHPSTRARGGHFRVHRCDQGAASSVSLDQNRRRVLASVERFCRRISDSRD
jgi:acetylornithine deacetylase